MPNQNFSLQPVKTGKNRKTDNTIHVFDPIHNQHLVVDSSEELDVLYWLIESVNLGIIEDFEYQPKSFLLCDKITYTPVKKINRKTGDVNTIKNKNKKIHPTPSKTHTLYQSHVYTADFKIIFKKSAVKFSDKLLLKWLNEFKIDADTFESTPPNGDIEVYIDVKGTFQKFTDRAFGYNQKWVYQRYNIYIYKLVPKKFFKLFGVPTNCQYTQKTLKLSKKYLGYNLIPTVFQL